MPMVASQSTEFPRACEVNPPPCLSVKKILYLAWKDYNGLHFPLQCACWVYGALAKETGRARLQGG